MGYYVGIDISKHSFDVAVHETSEYRHFSYDAKGIRQCVQWLLKLEIKLVLMEYTGGYEQKLAKVLSGNSIPIRMINPRRIRDFARSGGRMAKTDKLDAFAIARYGAMYQLTPQVQPDELTTNLKALASRRSQLVEMRTKEKNRREHMQNALIVQSVNGVIQRLDEEVAAIEQAIDKELETSAQLKQAVEIMQSMPGIGKQTATLLACQLPELGQCNRREITSLAGLAPVSRDSGKYHGKRMIGGGRDYVRHLLYMPTLAAINHNPRIREFYKHLLSEGKEKMVAVAACMRKILVILNSMVKTGTYWNAKALEMEHIIPHDPTGQPAASPSQASVDSNTLREAAICGPEVTPKGGMAGPTRAIYCS